MYLLSKSIKMEKLSMCRLCLAVNVRFYNIVNTHLQDLYEMITSIPFETKDQRPHQVCYICCALLRNCYKLRTTSLRSDELFTQILNNTLDPALCRNTMTLKITHPLIVLSNIPDTAQTSNDDGRVKKEPLVMIDGFTVKEEINDADLEENNLNTVSVPWENDIIDYGVHAISETHSISKTSSVCHTKKGQQLITEDMGDTKNISSKLYQNESQYPISESNLCGKIKSSIPKDTTDLIKDIKLEKYIDLGVKIPDNSKIGNSDSECHTSESNVCTKIVKIILHRIEDTELSNVVADAQIKKESQYGFDEYDVNIFQDMKTVSQFNTAEKGFIKKEDSIKVSTHTGDNQFKWTSSQIYKCDVREERYENNTVSKHIRNNNCRGFYKGDICEMRFCDARVSNKLANCESSKRTDNNSKDAKINKNLFKCDVCEKCYTYKCNLRRHYDIHTGKSYECDICKKSFIRKCNLKNHMKRHFNKPIRNLNRNKPHKCNTCGKRFYNKYNLNMHTLIHTGERPYKCDTCEKSFNHKGHLNVHIRIHTGEKPFKCDFCGKSYSNQSHLIYHVRKHTGEKPYECNLCTKKYSKKSHLNNHVLTHADVKPYKCDVCKKLYSTKESIRVHIRSQHH